MLDWLILVGKIAEKAVGVYFWQHGTVFW